VALVLEVSSMWTTSATYDEPGHIEFGRRVLDRRGASESAQKMAISALNALPGRALDALGVTPSARVSLFVARLPSVLASLGLVALVFAWARRLYGPRGAWLAAALCAVCPTVIAHSRLATNDVFCAALMLAATLRFLGYLTSPTPGRLMACAAVTGAAQVTKHTALLLLPIFALLWIVDAVRAPAGAAPRVRRLVVHGLAGALIALLVINAAYLFRGTFISVHAYLAEYRAKPSPIRDSPSLVSLASWVSRLPDVPVPLPHAYVYALATGVLYNATGGGHGPVYLLGEVSRTGFWHYFLVAVALKTPLASLLLIAAALALTPRWLAKRPLEEAALLVPAAVVLAFFSFACTAQLGIRYVLPMFPFLFVATGKVAATIPARHAAACAAVVGGLVLWAAVSTVSFHPHYLAYVNELIADRTSTWRYLADSNVDWGQDDDAVRRYLAAAGPGGVALVPASPVRGRVLVNVNSLVGVTAPREQFAWLRDRHRPVGHIGYSWLIYEIPGE
jgi:4-amino-4-deoxy-L-arabinose transferase-like glycosyltransferase